MSTNDAPQRQYASLTHALDAHGIPSENHTLIRRFCEEVGILSFHERSGYIKAVRADGGPALQITYGFTNGFLSEDEVKRAVGDDARCWASRRGTGQWGVDHPINKPRGSDLKAKDSQTDFGTCQVHFLRLPATRVCSECTD